MAAVQLGDRVGLGLLHPKKFEHENRMLRHRKWVITLGLAVPARDAGKAVGDVGKFHIERRGVENIEPSA
jgi:CRISPR/Cas system CSM-associated protein Csm4 (group 5 of RAMP superfamily)